MMAGVWTTITEGQGAVLNGLLTLISAVIGVLLGAVLFGNRVKDIESAIEQSKETIELHFTKAEVTLAKVRDMAAELGSRLIEFHSQNKTVAASMIAEKKVSGQRSYRVATRRQSFRRPNMISMRLRRL